MEKAQILIVEDEAIVSMDLRYKLESLGYTVPAEAKSGEDAVAVAPVAEDYRRAERCLYGRFVQVYGSAPIANMVKS